MTASQASHARVGDPVTRKDILLPMLTFVSGAAIALITAFASPLANKIVGGKEDELRQKSTQLAQELETLKKNNAQLQHTHDDLLSSQLEEWTSKNRRLISYQMAVLENEVRKTINNHQTPTIEILGINATGPLHQGREALIDVIKAGGIVRILVLDPDSPAFAGRAELEGDTVSRISAELLASLHIVMDLATHTNQLNPNSVEIRLSPSLADRSLIVINPDSTDGVVLSNPYETLRQKRGLAAKMWKFSTSDAFGKEDCAYFDKLWNSAERIELQRAAIPKWPYLRLGRALQVGP